MWGSIEPSPEELALFRAGNTQTAGELGQALVKSSTVHVEEGGEVDVVFGATSAASIHIRGVVLRGKSPAASLRVRAVDSKAKNPFGAAQALTDESGRFDLAVESAGKYRVQALPGGEYGMPTGPELDVPAGGVDSIEITLGGGRIAGTAHALKTNAKGMIQVVLQRSEHEAASNTSGQFTWPDSSFDFKDLSVGTYTLVATCWLMDGQGRPKTMLEPVRQKIELAENQDIVDLRIDVGGN